MGPQPRTIHVPDFLGTLTLRGPCNCSVFPSFVSRVLQVRSAHQPQTSRLTDRDTHLHSSAGSATNRLKAKLRSLFLWEGVASPAPQAADPKTFPRSREHLSLLIGFTSVYGNSNHVVDRSVWPDDPEMTVTPVLFIGSHHGLLAPASCTPPPIPPHPPA